MRKLVSLVFNLFCILILGFGFSLNQALAHNHINDHSHTHSRGSSSSKSTSSGGKSCEAYLNSTDDVNPDAHLDKALATLESAKTLLQKAKDHGFFSKSKFEHLMDDLHELESILPKKTKHQTFNFILDQWAVFLQNLNPKLDSYLKLNPTEQKTYFTKMQMPLVFMSSHFVTFLETSHLKFKYQRLNSILKSMNSQEVSKDIKLYLYQFEKSVMKFFSLKEFLSCKA